MVIGGDDSVTFPSLLATLDRFGDNFGYLRFDSHADMNLYKSSPTKNFHGMYHRPLFDNFDIPEIADLVKRKIVPQNVLFIGNLNLDSEEAQFFKKSQFRNIDGNQIKKKSPLAEVVKFISSFKYLHVSFDIDALDNSVAPATGIPAVNGLLWKDCVPIIRIIREKVIAFDLVEVNPKRRGAMKTISVAQKILATILL